MPATFTCYTPTLHLPSSLDSLSNLWCQHTNFNWFQCVRVVFLSVLNAHEYVRMKLQYILVWSTLKDRCLLTYLQHELTTEKLYSLFFFVCSFSSYFCLPAINLGKECKLDLSELASQKQHVCFNFFVSVLRSYFCILLFSYFFLNIWLFSILMTWFLSLHSVNSVVLSQDLHFCPLSNWLDRTDGHTLF